VDTYRFQPAEQVHRKQVSFGYVGRISPEKCPALLVRAYALMRQRGHDVRLRVVGGDDPKATGPGLVRYREMQLPEVKAFMNERQRCERLGFDGPVWAPTASKEPEMWYQTMDALVLASRYESAPHVILEALAAGVPVIAPDVGDCAEMVGDAGIVYQHPGYGWRPSLGELVPAMERFCAMSEDERGNMSKLARQRALVRYSLELHEADMVAHVLGSVLGFANA
jgi:glycosyltransferase involved in cell wall biosynthesis